MRFRTLPRVIALIGALPTVAGAAFAQQPEAMPTVFRVVHVAAGPRGAEAAGEFRLDEERTRFSRSSDTQVVVHFVWDGTPGVHRLAARWRSPTGGIAMSEIEYDARDRRFGAYWTLPISPSTPVGTWSIEATINGLPGGAFNFEVTEGDDPTPATKARPSPPELYNRLESIYVSIDRRASRDGVIDRNGGFVFGPATVVTAFSAIDAADGLELAAPDGTHEPITTISSWDRAQDWAVFSAPTVAGNPLPVAPAGSADVGDRCYSMESGATGSRVLVECAIVGRGETSKGGDRLIVHFLNGRGVPGSPVLNDYGEVIGLVGGAPPAGFKAFGALGAGAAPGTPVVPAAAIRPAGEAVSVQDLRRRGVLLSAVNGRHNIQSAGFAREIQEYPVRPIDQRETFSRDDGRFFVFVSWDPKERLRGHLVLRAFDEDNRVVTESKPSKTDLKPGRMSFSHWQLSVPKQPGGYRVDILLGDVPIWRGLFRVTH